MDKRSSVNHSKVSTDEPELWCYSVVFKLAAVKHISILEENLIFKNLAYELPWILGIVVKNVQFNYLVFYLTVLTMSL